MSEEESQVFRTDEHMEVAAAEGHARKKARAAKGPSDQRAVKDQEGGPAETRSIRDGEGASDIRRMQDAQGGAATAGAGNSDGPSDLRATQDAEGKIIAGGAGNGDGPSDLRAMQDSEGKIISAGAGNGDGPSDARAMQDADGKIISAGAGNGEGPSDIRDMRDAEGNPLLRRSEDGEGPSDQRKLQDHWANIPEAIGNADQETGASAETNTPSAAPEPTEPDMVFMTEENAAPWALSIHLEERLQNLGAMNSKVSAQLDVLEDAVKRLGKRIGR
jgi:hypothetical protein